MIGRLLALALLLVACDGAPVDPQPDAGLSDSGPPMGDIVCEPDPGAGGEVRPICPDPDRPVARCVDPNRPYRYTEETTPDGMVTVCVPPGEFPDCESWPTICPAGMAAICIPVGIEPPCPALD